MCISPLNNFQKTRKIIIWLAFQGFNLLSSSCSLPQCAFLQSQWYEHINIFPISGKLQRASLFYLLACGKDFLTCILTCDNTIFRLVGKGLFVQKVCGLAIPSFYFSSSLPIEIPQKIEINPLNCMVF